MARPTTRHYGIAEYGGQGTADPMDVYRVYNPAMETIDQILFGHEGEIGQLKNRMDAAEVAIAALDEREQNHYTEVKGLISALDAKVERYHTELAQSITNLEKATNQKFEQVNQNITNLGTKTDSIWTAIQNVLAKIMGGGTVDKSTGAITWPQSGTIPVGNINVFSGTGFLRTRAGEQDNDVKVV